MHLPNSLRELHSYHIAQHFGLHQSFTLAAVGAGGPLHRHGPPAHSPDLANVQLGLKQIDWFPRSVGDIQLYFRYHKDVEVMAMMESLNDSLGFALPVDTVRAKAYFHDLSKVSSWEELKKIGYSGWCRQEAMALLQVLLPSTQEVDLAPILAGPDYLSVDLKSRLLFLFSLSDVSLELAYSEPKQRQILRQALSSLRYDINYFDEKLAAPFYQSPLWLRLTDQQQQQLLLLELLSDFAVRTENPVARIEYFKIFRKSSRSLADAGSESFVYKSLLQYLKPEFLESVGLAQLQEMFLVAENSYWPMLEGLNTKWKALPQGTGEANFFRGFVEMLLREKQLQQVS